MVLPDEWHPVHPRLTNLFFIVVKVIALAFTVMVRVAVLLGLGGSPLLTNNWTV
jgi:hypothetical protein